MAQAYKTEFMSQEEGKNKYNMYPEAPAQGCEERSQLKLKNDCDMAQKVKNERFKIEMTGSESRQTLDWTREKRKSL